MLRTFVVAGVLAAAAGLAACEKAGEKVDSAIEELADGKKDMKDGAFEKAGEAVDGALGVKNKDNADSLADAVDSDPKTKPN